MSTTTVTTTVMTVTTAALAAVEDPNQANFEAATTVAQIFSGIVFGGLGIWLTVSNGTKMSYIQRASLEKRLQTCCQIDTYVALFSCFFNLFQLTEVDDFLLPETDQSAGGFTLDFARPIEWICTCPLMQVVLVLMGGSKIPENRRILMPGLSLVVLFSGTMSTLVQNQAIKIALYANGLVNCAFQFFLNAKQVIEHSDGDENMWAGDSEFRKASLLLIVTWFPFPCWYILSPEGLGVINDVLIIQMGWAFLNILSKFSFIFYIQRVKDNYCNRLKVRRELLGTGKQDDPTDMIAGMMGMMPASNPQADKEKHKQKELAAVVVETMTFLGMAQHNDRFIKLLRQSQIRSVQELEQLSKEESDRLQLPWDLISATQKRIKIWKLEMTDNAEMELEKGEAYYLEHTPRDAGMPGAVGTEDDMRQRIMQGLMNANGGGGGGGDPQFQREVQGQLSQMAEMISMLQQQQENMGNAFMRRQTEMEGNMKWQFEQMMEHQQQNAGGEQLLAQISERTEQAIDMLGRSVVGKMEGMLASQQRANAENESGMLQKINQMIQKQSEASADAMSNTLQAKLDMSQAQQFRTQTDFTDNMMQTLESIQQKIGSSSRSVEEGQEIARGMQTRMDDLTTRQLKQLEDNIRRRLEENMDSVSSKFDKSVQNIRTGVQGDVQALANGNQLVAETVRTTSDTQMEGLADLRRLSMMVLEQSSAALEKTQGGFGKIDVLQGTVDSGFGRVLEKMGGGGGAGGADWRPQGGGMSPRQVSGGGNQFGDGSRRPSQTAAMYGNING